MTLATREPKDDPIDLTCKDVAHQLTASHDNTVYWKSGPASAVPTLVREHFSQGGQANRSKSEFRANEPTQVLKSLNQQVTMKLPGVEEPTGARACVCKCYRGQCFSATFRSVDSPVFKPEAVSDRSSVTKWKCARWGRLGTFLLETFELTDALFNSIWPSGIAEHPSGLVVFAGSTCSGKTNLAQAFALQLVQKALDRHNAKDRLPHLVTFEDPIEDWILSTRECHPDVGQKDDGVKIHHTFEESLKYGFCFTPREERKDVASLSDAIADAKRQTPVCFYAGEVRNRKWWNEIIEFAGSGHMVVATTHAGRLSETMSRIIEATKALTPAARRNVGSYISACIHLEIRDIELPNGTSRKAVLPSVWAHRGAALASLVADGLSSVTPNGDYVLSRRQFLETQFFDDTGAPRSVTQHRKLDETDRAFLKQALVIARTLDSYELLQQ